MGFVTVSYLFPRYLPADVIGLFGLLVSYSILFAQFSSLGVTGVTARLFPYFRNNQNNHHGFLFLSLLIMTFGFALFLVLYLFLSPILIESNIEKSKLFAEYVYLLVPLTLFTLLFVYFDTYNKVLYDAVYGTVLQEFVQRVLILGITVLFIFKFINLNQLVLTYAFAISVKAVIIFIHLFRKGEISFKPYLSFIDKNLRKEIINVGIYSIIGGFGSAVVFSIDKILVNQMIDLESTGIYTIAFSFGILVSIPSRSLLKISSTVIAEAWKKNDLEQIKSIYRKSCLNQFIIGGLLFIGIWANIDNIFNLIGNDYLEGKWVIFFIGIGFLIDMLTGVNGYIIVLSKFYRISVVFVSVLIVLVVVTNLIFIPLWGITGAAVAT
ncbi:MAG: lipopolysaccharide biosynthesis protein, partial [Mariniphaga sp.]